MKTPKKIDKAVKFADKCNKDSKGSNKICKSKIIKTNHKKNTTSNTISEIQTSDSDQDTDIGENDSDSTGWNTLPYMVMTSHNSGTSDTDGTE